MLRCEVRGEVWKRMFRAAAEDLMSAEGGAWEWAAPEALEAYLFGNDLIDRGREVNKQVVLKVAGRTSKVGVVGLSKLGDSVNCG